MQIIGFDCSILGQKIIKKIGCDMESINKMRLNSTEQNKIRNNLNDIEYSALGNNDYINEIRKAGYLSLPEQIVDILTNQSSSKNLISHFLVDNMPIDDCIYGSPDFYQTGSNYKSGVLSENILCAVSSIIGEPYSIAFEGRELVNNLTPQKNTQNDYTGLGSTVELDFHIENAALQYITEDDYSPKGMFLLGIRTDKRIAPAKTYISDARLALKILSSEDIDILYGENFSLKLPYRWRTAIEGLNTKPCPVIRGPLELPRLSVAFYPDMIIPLNIPAKRALENLHNAIKTVSMSISIKHGNLVYIDNRYTLHSREKFSPTYDHNGCPYRWLQRIFFTSDLWAFRKFPKLGDRIYDPSQNISGDKDVFQSKRVA